MQSLSDTLKYLNLGISHTKKFSNLPSNFPLDDPVKPYNCQLIITAPTSATSYHVTLSKLLNFWGLSFFIRGTEAFKILLFYFFGSFHFSEDLSIFSRNQSAKSLVMY